MSQILISEPHSDVCRTFLAPWQGRSCLVFKNCSARCFRRGLPPSTLQAELTSSSSSSSGSSGGRLLYLAGLSRSGAKRKHVEEAAPSGGGCSVMPAPVMNHAHQAQEQKTPEAVLSPLPPKAAGRVLHTHPSCLELRGQHVSHHLGHRLPSPDAMAPVPRRMRC